MPTVPDSQGQPDVVRVSRPYQDLFAQVYHRVIEDVEVTQHGLLAYVAVARYADFSDHTCTVGRKKLAKTARVSLRSLDAGLLNLQERGYLKITRVQRVDKSWGPSEYLLLDTLGAQLATGGVVQEVHEGVVHQVHEGSAGDARPLVQDVHEGGAGPAHQERETFKEIQTNDTGANLAVVQSATGSKSNKRATRIPDGWVPSDQLIQWAKAKGCPSRKWVDDQTERFILWAEARGRTYVSWDRGWQNWIAGKLEEISQQPARNRTQPTASHQQGMFT